MHWRLLQSDDIDWAIRTTEGMQSWLIVQLRSLLSNVQKCGGRAVESPTRPSIKSIQSNQVKTNKNFGHQGLFGIKLQNFSKLKPKSMFQRSKYNFLNGKAH